MKCGMENKEEYYTPKLEELHYNYQCEINFPNEDDEWLSTKLDNSDIYHIIEDVNNNLNLRKIRTEFLSKEDIKNEGWEMDTHRAFFEILKDIPDLEIANKVVGDRIYNLIYHKPNSWLTIKMQDLSGSIKEDKPIHTIYYGKCLSINELRKL